jgi:hypothetical protein
MSETKSNPLEAMLAQYETNNKPKYTPRADANVYDLKNYFNTFMKDGVESAKKEIRILPTADGSSPFVEMYGHKVQVEGVWKTFACLKHEKGEACPFCEAREALLATGKDSDKELAKKYNAKLMYVVKVIDRDLEAEGVKFWRINHDYRKTGVMDKIHGLLSSLKKDRDFSNADSGRDLVITINRDQNKKPVVSSIVALDATPLSENAELKAKWVADPRTWENVYSVRTYDYLEIIVKGGVPAWDKEAKKFVDKASLKAEDGEALQQELTIGVENVKAGVTTATSTSTTTPAGEDSKDDLPF